ncbi:MAG TPA: hypothetical protein VGU20_28145 [Stellaceae bacterium]|nr:hypothetical protein [Stellaceae bacterium]
MSAKHRNGGDQGSCGWTDINRLGQATGAAFDSARAALARYDELVATAQRETALLLWRGMAPTALDGPLASSLDATKRAVIASFSQGIALAEIAAQLQLEGVALLRRVAAESLAFSQAPLSADETTPKAR